MSQEFDATLKGLPDTSPGDWPRLLGQSPPASSSSTPTFPPSPLPPTKFCDSAIPMRFVPSTSKQGRRTTPLTCPAASGALEVPETNVVPPVCRSVWFI